MVLFKSRVDSAKKQGKVQCVRKISKSLHTLTLSFLSSLDSPHPASHTVFQVHSLLSLNRYIISSFSQSFIRQTPCEFLVRSKHLMDCVCLLRMPLSPLPRFLSNTAYFIQNSERNPFYREDSPVSSKAHFASSFSVFATLCMHFFYLLSIWDDNYRFTYLSPSLACERSEGRACPSVISEALVPGSWSEPSKYLMNEEGMKKA